MICYTDFMNPKGSTLFIVIGIIVLIIIVGAVGYFMWKKTAETNQVLTTTTTSVSSSSVATSSSGVWNFYVFQSAGFEVAVPPIFISPKFKDPSNPRIIFSKAPAESDGDIVLSLESTILSQGESLLDFVKNSDAEFSSIVSVPNGDASYVKWFSQGQGEGNWNYIIAISGDQAIIASTPSSSSISDEDVLSILYSLRPLPPPSLADISSWRKINVSSTGLIFSMPNFGIPYDIDVTTSTDALFLNIKLQATSSAEFRLSIYNNPKNLSLQDWFEQNVDDEGALLSHGGYAQQMLSNNVLAYIAISSAPLGYVPGFGGYGPRTLQQAFMQSSSTGKIIGIDGSPNDFYNYGFTTQDAGIQLQLSILSTVHF